MHTVFFCNTSKPTAPVQFHNLLFLQRTYNVFFIFLQCINLFGIMNFVTHLQGGDALSLAEDGEQVGAEGV